MLNMEQKHENQIVYATLSLKESRDSLSFPGLVHNMFFTVSEDLI